MSDCIHERVAVHPIDPKGPKVEGQPYWYSCCLACGHRSVLYVVTPGSRHAEYQQAPGDDPSAWTLTPELASFYALRERIARESGISVAELIKQEPLFG